jgi:hypothetical protein
MTSKASIQSKEIGAHSVTSANETPSGLSDLPIRSPENEAEIERQRQHFLQQRGEFFEEFLRWHR